MNNKILIIAIGLSLVSVIIGTLGKIFFETELDLMIDYGFVFFLLFGSYFLLKNGEYIKTQEFRFTRLGISTIIVGVLFKIMHWPMSGLILALGFLSILVLYLKYIIRNGNRNAITWIKLLFLTTFLIGRFFKIIHWPYSEELTITSFLLLILLIFNLLRNNKTMLNNNY